MLLGGMLIHMARQDKRVSGASVEGAYLRLLGVEVEHFVNVSEALDVALGS